MKGGCFVKILTFLFGVIVGFVLFAGTLAGGIYYAVAKITINDVEKYANTEFTIIDSEAEIRDKSILDIVNMVSSGDIKNITVAGVKKTFGVDIIKIVEDTLQITLKEDGKEQLNELPVLQVFQGDNLKIVLNSVTLRDVLTKAGVDFTSSDSLGSKPVLTEHLDEPVIDAFNAILKSLNINDMTVAEMEYLLGISFGGSGILDNLSDYKISELNDAINDITLEKIMPDFDRDLYFDTTGARYTRSAWGQAIAVVDLSSYFNTLADGATRTDGVDYYVLDTEKGTVKVDSTNGTLYLKEGKTLPDFRERYGKDADGNYVSNRNGYYYANVPEGTFNADRFSDEAASTQDNFGLFRYVYTESATGNYTLGYAAVKTESGIVMEARKFMPTTAAEVDGYAEYQLNVDTYERKDAAAGAYEAAIRYDVTTNAESKTELTESLSGRYVGVHIGTSQPILKSLADESLSTMDGAVGDIKFNQIIKITPDDGILYELRNSTLNTLPDDVKLVKISSIMKIETRNIVEAAADGQYIALPSGNTYAGTYVAAYTSAESETPIYMVKYRTGLDDSGEFFAGCQRYNITVKASNAVVANLGTKTVGQLQEDGVEDLINSATLSGVIDIDGDVYKLAFDNYTAAVASGKTLFVFFDSAKDFFVENSADYTSATEFYEKIYSGGSDTSAVIKKMANIKINDVSTRMQTIINETRLNEVLTVNEDYIIREATSAELSDDAIMKYNVLSDTSTYFGTFAVGKIEGTTDNVTFVRADGTAESGYVTDTTKYVVVEEISNGVLIKMSNTKIGDMTANMQDVVNSAYLSDVIDISGDVYVKLTETTYAAAQAANVGVQLYYHDDSGLFLKAGYHRATDGDLAYVKLDSTEGTPSAGDGSYVTFISGSHDGFTKYKLSGGTETEFYKKIYVGKSDSILRKLATITAQALGESGTMNKAINDSTLEEIGVAPSTDDEGMLYQIKDYRIDELSYAIKDKCANASMAQLNSWCNLGLTDAQLNKKITVGGVDKRIGDMKASTFLTSVIDLIGHD